MTHSRSSRPSRIFAALLVALALGSSSLSGVAQAFGPSPTLDSFSVNGGPNFDPGDEVSVDYAATGVGFPITGLNLSYTDACGKNEGFSGGTNPVTFTFPQNSWRFGPHSLGVLSVSDSFGNYTTYARNGTMTYYPAGGAAIQGTHTLDLSAGDFVMGDDPDAGCTSPTLDSFSVNGGPNFDPGDEVSVDYAATGVGFPITGLNLSYTDACGKNEGFSGGTNPVTFTFPQNSWRFGPHSLGVLSVSDSFGNYTTYARNGTMTYYPAGGAAIQGTHTLDLSAGDFVMGDDPDAGLCILSVEPVSSLSEAAKSKMATLPSSGVVTSVPAGIACPPTCSSGFSPGTVVTLTATPDPGSEFDGWGGDCSGTSPCTTTMSGDHVVQARFRAAPLVMQPDAMVAAHRNGPFRGDDIYGLNGLRQTVWIGTSTAGSVTAYARIENDGDDDRRLTLDEVKAPDGYVVRYWRGGSEITSAVRKGTFTTTPLAPGEGRPIRVTITSRHGHPAADGAIVLRCGLKGSAAQDVVKFRMRPA